MGKNIAKNIGTSLSRKYSQKCFDHAKKSATYALITSSKKIIKKKQQKQLVIFLVIK